MNQKIVLYFILLFFFSQWGCVPYQEEKLTEVKLDYRDSLFQTIYKLQDEQAIEKLYPYFRHKDPSYQYIAALANHLKQWIVWEYYSKIVLTR